MKIDIIAGARPNFVKIAALIHAIENQPVKIDFRLIHTGQHYDESLSGSFFSQLGIPKPEINFGIGSGTQAEQTAKIMVAYEKVLHLSKPSFCLVVGDVTSSMACAVTAKKMQVEVVHVEAGIRSNDWSMPEEVNRVLIDSISNYFFTTTREASKLLSDNGIAKENIFFAGNTMIDTLLRFRPQFKRPALWNELQITKQNYIVITIHRPGNLEDLNQLKFVLEEIIKFSNGSPIIFPAHPRTAALLSHLKIAGSNLHIVNPLSYLEFNFLIERAKVVITDSGGITEETSVLNVPCMTLRDNTERPETIKLGTNILLGKDLSKLPAAMDLLEKGKWKNTTIPEFWDGQAGKRIINILKGLYNN